MTRLCADEVRAASESWIVRAAEASTDRWPSHVWARRLSLCHYQRIFQHMSHSNIIHYTVLAVSNPEYLW